MRKSCVHVYTGDGKGKTTAAMGLAVRALGRGKTVKIVQFLKGRSTGEMLAFEKFERAEFFQVSKCKKFFPDMTEVEKKTEKQVAQDFLHTISSWLGNTDIIILDEAMGAISTGLLGIDDVCRIIDGRKSTEIVLTGRNAPGEIQKRADLITEMKAVRHYMDFGVNARAGIEF